MKKTTKAFIALCVMGVIVLGCAFYFAFKPTTSNDVEGNNTQQEMPAATPSLTDEAENAQNTSDACEKLAEMQERINKMEEDATESAKALQEAKSENETLKKENEELKDQIVPEVEVIDGVVYADVDYFVERATSVFDDGTAALLATTEGEEVVLVDSHALDARGNYRAKLVSLPLNDDKLAITFDSVEVKTATFGSKGLQSSSKMETGYELVEVSKEEWDEELQLVAVRVPNSNSDDGYDYRVKVEENAAKTQTKKDSEQDKSEQDKTEQDKTEQDKTEQDNPEQDKPEQDNPEQENPDNPANNTQNTDWEDVKDNISNSNNSTNSGFNEAAGNGNGGSTGNGNTSGNGNAAGNGGSTGNDDTWYPSDIDSSSTGWNEVQVTATEEVNQNANWGGNSGYADLVASLGG